MRIQQSSVVLDNDYKNILVKGFAKNYTGVENLQSPENIVQVMRDVFHLEEKAEEHLYLICMTNDCRPISFFEVSHGTCNAAIVGAREIFIRALLCGAVGIVLVHNHPSGNSNPSQEDIRLTKKLQLASKLIGIPLCDHIILGRDSFYSFCENKELTGCELEKIDDKEWKEVLQ